MFKNGKLLAVIFVSLLIFSPALNNFFASDDWFHLEVSQISSPDQFLNFFSFSPTEQSTPFYRPLSTQIFFFIFQNLFNLNPLPYHLFVFTVFAACLYVIYELGLIIFEDKNKALLTTFIYGISATNFTRLYFISVVQEILMLFFSLLCLFMYAKYSNNGKYLAPLFFILALLSKDTAIVIPLILIVFDLLKRKVDLYRIFPYFLVIFIYLFMRLQNINEGITSSYIFDFSLRKLLNTFSWYFLWSLGAPELLVDYVSSGFRIISRFYSDFPLWWKIILPLTSLSFISFTFLIIKNFRKLNNQFLFGLLIFIFGLLPVIFFPMHKFTLQLTLSMVGFSVLIASLFKKNLRSLNLIFLSLFTILNLVTNLLTYQTHYSVSRSRISKSVFEFFKHNYQTPPKNSYFVFINDSPDFGRQWGSSKQISQSTSNSDLFKVLYKDKNYKVYFEDLDDNKIPKDNGIVISTQMFLR